MPIISHYVDYCMEFCMQMGGYGFAIGNMLIFQGKLHITIGLTDYFPFSENKVNLTKNTFCRGLIRKKKAIFFQHGKIQQIFMIKPLSLVPQRTLNAN